MFAIPVRHHPLEGPGCRNRFARIHKCQTAVQVGDLPCSLVITDDYAVWATASEDSIVGAMPDLVLKHGAKVAGQWSMLGILDALPFEEDQMLSGMEIIRTGMTTDGIAKAALGLAPAIRQMLGRPLLSYGMTPLLVFREVA